MTNPSPSPGPQPAAPSPSAPTSKPSVPRNPDGTPNLGGAAPPSAGNTTIWNMPKGVDPSKNIWFDVGHKENITAPHGGIANEATQAAKGIHATSYEIMTSPNKIMAQFAAMSYNDPNKFLELQLALASGPFGRVNVTGSFDPATETALGQAMLQYVKLSQGAGVGVSFSDYLLKAADTAQKLKQQNAPPAQQVVTSDPESIRQAAQSAAMDALGQGLSQDQLSAFVAKFQSAQTSAQQQVGGTVSSPDLSSEAMAYAQQQNPDEFKQNQRQSYVSSLVNLLGGSLTSRPSQQPVPSA